MRQCAALDLLNNNCYLTAWPWKPTHLRAFPWGIVFPAGELARRSAAALRGPGLPFVVHGTQRP